LKNPIFPHLTRKFPGVYEVGRNIAKVTKRKACGFPLPESRVIQSISTKFGVDLIS
jgi:hypothetical protein